MIGIASANENGTDTGDFKDLIDDCEENGTVKLEEKTYELNPENETHLYLNKSITIEGTNEKTVIDGKNSTLFLDVEKDPEPDNGIVVSTDSYKLKNTGKHIIFKNITFKDLNMISLHKMDFIDCKFMNTNFVSKELDTNFDNSVFNESKIELNLYDYSIYNYYSKVANCTLYNSKIISKTNTYIEIVGSSRIFIKNGLDLINSRLFNSDIQLSHYNIKMTNLKLHDTNLKGWSDFVKITNTSFYNPKINLGYSEVHFEQTNLNNSRLMFEGGYYNKGCEVTLKNSVTNHSTFEFTPNYYSGPSSFIIENLSCENSKIKLIETNLKVNKSNLNNTTIESVSSNLNISNSKFYMNGSISDTIIINKKYLVNTSNIIENSYLINDTGEYKINNPDINIDTLYRISFKNTDYYINDNLTLNIKGYNGNPVSKVRLYIENPNDPYTVMALTDENGNANYTFNTIGKLSLKVYYYGNDPSFKSQKYQIEINLTVKPKNNTEINSTTKPKITDIKLDKNYNSTKYSKINSFLKVKLISDYTNGLTVLFKVYSGKKYKIYTENADSNGEIVFKIPKSLKAGNHRIEVIFDGKIMKTTYINIQKAHTIVKAPKVVNKFKKSKYFKVTVKNKETKKLLSNVKVKIKVFTGKKFKTYIVKTNSKGIAKINTKNLKIGTHKVVISSGNDNYIISKKSSIKIKK